MSNEDIEAEVRRQLARAFDSDRYGNRIEYIDSAGAITRRIISPIRFEGAGLVLAICACRQEPRYFSISRIRSIETINAHEILMPEPIEELTK